MEQDTNNKDPKKNVNDTRFPVNAGITGYVAATGETVNVADAYNDSRFDPGISHQNALFYKISR